MTFPLSLQGVTSGEGGAFRVYIYPHLGLDPRKIIPHCHPPAGGGTLQNKFLKRSHTTRLLKSGPKRNCICLALGIGHLGLVIDLSIWRYAFGQPNIATDNASFSDHGFAP